MNFYVSYLAKTTIPGIKCDDHKLWVPTLEEAQDLLWDSKGGIIFDASDEPVYWWLEGGVKNPPKQWN